MKVKTNKSTIIDEGKKTSSDIEAFTMMIRKDLKQKVRAEWLEAQQKDPKSSMSKIINNILADHYNL